MLPAAPLEPRRLSSSYTTIVTRATPTPTSTPSECTPFGLPAFGIIRISPSQTITLPADTLYTPFCNPDGLDEFASSSIGISDTREPFHASVTPQVYATAAATVIAWMLVIMLLITPRTFFLGGAGGVSVLRGSRGMISGASGGASVIGVGSRPWLQKAAALSVAVSLTIATADTFRVAERQYHAGLMDASDIRNTVVAGYPLKVSRIVSDIFLWLAQVQTLIRLFPRHKEKVIIKWVGFALIILDMTFNCLNTFIQRDKSGSSRFEDAISALSYLFQLALSMLYAAWVVYYSITKRRYAYYHPIMWNVTVVAFLSLIAILTPVVFFITDIADATVAGWGDYFRWVGAAAASVIVWEWVERIEALEREDKKDGILGREVYDADDMLDFTSSTDTKWPGQEKNESYHTKKRPPKDGPPDNTFASGRHRRMVAGIARRIARITPVQSINTTVIPLGKVQSQSIDNSVAPIHPNRPPTSSIPTPPPAIASPVSRTDTTSAASTVYAVRYHPINEPIAPFPARLDPGNGTPDPNSHSGRQPASVMFTGLPGQRDESTQRDEPHISITRKWQGWHTVPNPFKRKRFSPPAEVLGGKVIEPFGTHSDHKRQSTAEYGRWDVKGRFTAFAADQSERLKDRMSGRPPPSDLPVTIIPAQPRGRTWSPDVLQNQSMQPSAFQEPSPWSLGHPVEEHPDQLDAQVDPTSRPVAGDIAGESGVQGADDTTPHSFVNSSTTPFPTPRHRTDNSHEPSPPVDPSDSRSPSRGAS